ncbi:MAG TPA: Lrp/AsnC ligand binding domain-containing protein [Anaerolineae bacterium]|nr:Lrp/AsnC ligand binding domain-containing protein [Anaerolineae bacterium]
MRAYMLITVQGDARAIAEKIRALTGVKYADAVSGGSTNVIAVVEADDAKALDDAGMRMQEMTGVTSIETDFAL